VSGWVYGFGACRGCRIAGASACFYSCGGASGVGRCYPLVVVSECGGSGACRGYLVTGTSPGFYTRCCAGGNGCFCIVLVIVSKCGNGAFAFAVRVVAGTVCLFFAIY
jgi:hypothetical protein